MNRTQKFVINSITTALNQIVVMIVGFITPSLMIRTYGSEINGLVSSINQLIGYISLVEAGLSGAAIYSLYKPLAEHDEKGINAIVSAARKFYLQAGYIFSSAALVLSVVYGYLKSSASISFSTIFFLTLILSVNGCVDFFVLSRYRVILTADQRTYVISIVGIVQTIIRTIIIVVCALAKINVVVLYTLTLLPIVIKIIVLFGYCKKNYKFLNFKEEPNIAALGRRYDVIYQQILGMVQTGAPAIIATIVLDFFSVSIYAVYNMVMSGLNGILSIFISGLPAGFGEIIAKKEYETLKETTSQFEVAYYFILTIVYGITFAMMLPFIKIYTCNFQDTNYILSGFSFFIVLNGLLYNIKTPQSTCFRRQKYSCGSRSRWAQSMLIISAGMYKETRWRVTFQGVIIVIGGFILAPFWKLSGIMIASCLSNLYRTIDLLYFVPKYITKGAVIESAIRMLRVILNIIVINIPCFLVDINPNGYPQRGSPRRPDPGSDALFSGRQGQPAPVLSRTANRTRPAAGRCTPPTSAFCCRPILCNPLRCIAACPPADGEPLWRCGIKTPRYRESRWSSLCRKGHLL